nr:hypothetical protein [uncultured Prevotella sp.]
MTQKDLAKEFLTKARENAMNFKDINFFNGPLFQENDIKAAFNAGRESVVEDASELEWKGYAPFIHADTPIGRYNIDNFGIWLLRFNGKEIPLPPGSSLEETKQTANEHYKKQIKQVLGL